MTDWKDSQVAWSGENLSRAKTTWVLRTRQKLKKKWTDGEKAFCRIIDKMKSRLPDKAAKYLWYVREKPWIVAPEIMFFGDFYFKTFKLLAEIDGDHHRFGQQHERDKWRSQVVAERGIYVVRFTNDEVLLGDFRDVERKFVDSLLNAGRMKRAAMDVRKAYEKSRLSNQHIYT